MSASKEKKNRVELRGAGNDKKRNAENAEAEQARKFRRNAIIATVCIVLVVAAALIINSNLFYRDLTAVTVGNVKYSAAETDVFYRNTYNSIYSSYQSQLGDFVSYIIDTSTPLTEQNYSEDQTWADYIFEQTKENMRQVTALYQEALANGYTLTEDDRASVDEQVATMSMYASIYGAGSVDQYLAAYYGKGVNEKIFRSVLEKMTVAQRYSDDVIDGLTYSQEQLDSYYAERADELDYIDYYTYTVSASDAAFDELADDEAKQTAARAAAEELAAAADLAGFETAVKAYDQDAAPSEQYLQGSSLSAGYSDWLLDGGRRAGDTTVIDGDGSFTVLMFMERDDNSYHLANMRHILIRTDDEETGVATDEAKTEASERINDILAQWQTDPTEDHFAELANEYSEDEGSNTNGGLYENIQRHQMVTAVNSFLFDQGTQAGDTAIVYGESGSYEGYHLIYFVGENERPYKDELAENLLKSNDYTAFIEDLTAPYAVSEGSGKRYVNLK